MTRLERIEEVLITVALLNETRIPATVRAIAAHTGMPVGSAQRVSRRCRDKGWLKHERKFGYFCTGRGPATD